MLFVEMEDYISTSIFNLLCHLISPLVNNDLENKMLAHPVWSVQEECEHHTIISLTTYTIIILLGSSDYFDFYTTVLGSTFSGAVVRNGLAFTFAIGVDPIGRNSLAYQVGLDGFGTSLTQL